MLELTCDTCVQKAETLHHFAGQDDVATLRQLLDGGADVATRDADGATPLHWAADRGTLGAVALLLENGADVNAVDGDGMTPLHYAACSGHEEVRVHLAGPQAVV